MLISGAIATNSMVGGPYSVGPIIGRGGVAEVRAGHDTGLDRPVAIKMVRTDIGLEPMVYQRFPARRTWPPGWSSPNVDFGIAKVMEAHQGDHTLPGLVCDGTHTRPADASSAAGSPTAIAGIS
jgi:eukaryotic-like serine/threonine-protein kinase